MDKKVDQDPSSIIYQEIHLDQLALDNVSVYIFMKDLNGCYTYANKMVRDLFNCTQDEIIGRDDSYFFSLDQSNELAVNDRLVMDKGVSIEKEERNVIMETGEVRYYWTVKKPIYDSNGKIIGLNGVSTDITEQKRMQFSLTEKERLLKTIINNVNAYIYMKDRKGRFLFINDMTAELFGIQADEAKGKSTKDILPKEIADNFDILDEQVIRTGEKVEGEETVTNENGDDRFYWSTKIPLFDEVGQLSSFIGFSTEITKIIEEKKEFEEQAGTDALTGVVNRRQFMTVAYQKQQDALRSGTGMSVMILDLDYFKKINDQYGHHTGDKVLKVVAETLRNGVRQVDLIARMGGEEFAVLLPNTQLDEAIQVAEKLRLKIEKLNVDNVQVTASIGVTCCALESEGLSKALIKADEGLYLAKHKGRNTVVGL